MFYMTNCLFDEQNLSSGTSNRSKMNRNKMHNTLINIIFIAFLLSFGQQCIAALGNVKERWYEVEVIVFSQNDKNAYEAEFWPEDVDFPKMRNSIDVINDFELFIDDEIEKLPLYYLEVDEERENSLDSLAAKIENSSRYDLLIHRSWRQTVPERSSGIPVYLDDRIDNALFYQPSNPETFESGFQETSDNPAEAALMAALLEEERALQNQQSVDSLLISEFDPIIPFEQIDGLPKPEQVQFGPTGPLLHRVYGTLKLHKSRYLHMSVNFLFRGKPVEPETEETPMDEIFPMASEETTLDTENIEEPIITPEQAPVLDLLVKEKAPLPGYQLKDNTRVRIANVYYFDHPMFGVIARVIKYEPPIPEETDLELEALENQ